MAIVRSKKALQVKRVEIPKITVLLTHTPHLLKKDPLLQTCFPIVQTVAIYAQIKVRDLKILKCEYCDQSEYISLFCKHTFP